MRRDLSIILAVSAFVLAPVAGAAMAAAPYCPPGSKFCPAPGADNTLAIDTHFGMDAQTGEVTAYRGTVHPDEVRNPPMTGEQLLYTSPPINVENRYVPYPGSPQVNMDATTAYMVQPPTYTQQPQPAQNYYPQPTTSYPQQLYPAPQPHYSPAPQTAYAQPPRPRATESEVANQQTAREARPDKTRNGEKIPWYKGGLWRNKKDDNDDPSRSSGNNAGATASASGRGSDLWDEEEYDGYNSDGSFGRANGQRSQNDQQSFAANAPQNGNPYGQQYSQPNGQPYPQQLYADPYQQPYSQPQFDSHPQTYAQNGGAGPRYASEPYTMPNSPGPTSPYQPGYTYPGTDISYESTNQGGYPQQLYSSPAQPQDYPQQYPVQLNGQQQQYVISTPQEVRDPFASASPNTAADQSLDDGSPQFQNAVRMVKENRFNEAKTILTSETSRNPSHAAAWRWLADCHYNLLELDDAITSYQRALNSDPNDYYALRGQGFSYLHRGHEYWRRMQEEVQMGQKEQAAATFAQAHENYKKSLELLGLCLRRAPNDGEAIYGEAMAAEGASRKLYSNAISFLKLGPEQRNRAELFAENCLTVINKGIERSRERAQQSSGDAGPRALLAGLYLRKAILYHSLGKNDLALIELKNSRDVQQSILDEIDKNNTTAQKNIKECESYWEAWGGNRQ